MKANTSNFEKHTLLKKTSSEFQWPLFFILKVKVGAVCSALLAIKLVL